MKAEQLLIPRFEILQEYPNCIFKKGEILNRLKYATNNWYHTDEKSINAVSADMYGAKELKK